MNATISPAAIAAFRRIQMLRELTQKTGLQTSTKQFEVLMGLNDEAVLIVAENIVVSRSQPIVSRPVGGVR